MSINYRDLRARLQISDVLRWMPWKASSSHGHQLRGRCPLSAVRRSRRLIGWRSQLLGEHPAEHLPLLQVQSERQCARPMEPLPSATDLRGSPRTGGPSSSKQSTARAPLIDRKTSNRKSATTAKMAQFLTAIDNPGWEACLKGNGPECRKQASESIVRRDSPGKLKVIF